MSDPTDSQALERIPAVQVHSGDKFVNTKGIHAIKDGIKRSQQSPDLLKKARLAAYARPEQPEI